MIIPEKFHVWKYIGHWVLDYRILGPEASTAQLGEDCIKYCNNVIWVVLKTFLAKKQL